jgi:TolA-binding protein
MRILTCLLVLVCLSVSTCTYAGSPDQQFAFAQKLLDEGDQAFAMLEFKRFLFETPKHVKAPEATYRIAQVQLSYFQNIVGAKKTLRTIVTTYPKTETARKAKAFADYIEINSDFSGKPLFLMLGGRADEKAGKVSEAVQKYQRIISEYPRARLVPDAAHDLAVLQLRQLKRLEDARKTLNWVVTNHSKHAIKPNCELLLAEMLEMEQGPTKDVIAAYRSLVTKYPKHAVAKMATAKVAELEKQAFALKRKFDKEFVRTYSVKQQGYTNEQSIQYVVKIEIPKGCSDRDVKATLEDALIKEGEKRKHPGHQVLVESFFSYPETEAGKATWTPGQSPQYVMPEPVEDDALKDVLFDLFRRGRL